MILIFNNELDETKNLYENSFNYFFEKTLKELNLSENCVMSVTFVSKEKIHQINKDYRNVDKETDVISFAFLDDSNEIIKSKDIPIDLGEIYICFDVADENRKNYNNSIGREINFLFVHGLLHLLGYDHQTKEDEEVMFGLQNKILEGEIFDD